MIIRPDFYFSKVWYKMSVDILYNNVKISMCQKEDCYAIFRDIYFTGIIIKYMVVFVKNIIVYATLGEKSF